MSQIQKAYATTAVDPINQTLPVIVNNAFNECDEVARRVIELAEFICGPSVVGEGIARPPCLTGLANEIEYRAKDSMELSSQAYSALLRIKNVFQ